MSIAIPETRAEREQFSDQVSAIMDQSFGNIKAYFLLHTFLKWYLMGSLLDPTGRERLKHCLQRELDNFNQYFTGCRYEVLVHNAPEFGVWEVLVHNAPEFGVWLVEITERPLYSKNKEWRCKFLITEGKESPNTVPGIQMDLVAPDATLYRATINLQTKEWNFVVNAPVKNIKL
jgi:hypothetical protein